MGVVSTTNINSWFRDGQQIDRQTDGQNASTEKASRSSKKQIILNDYLSSEYWPLSFS